MNQIESLVKLQEWFAKLPGIGPKSAARLVFSIIDMKPEDVKNFAQDMYKARLAVKACPICGNLTDKDLCPICGDSQRDQSTICVVQDSRDVLAIERAHEYKGVYHVLGGVISPLSGVGPDDIRVKELVSRIGKGQAREVILATNPDVNGETTAVYIAKLLEPFNVQVTRIAHGVPVGGELEYTDEITLMKSINGRRAF